MKAQPDLLRQLASAENGSADMDRGNIPTNSFCEGAIVEALAVGSSITRNGNNTNAPSAFFFNDSLVWEGFTTSQCADITVSYCGTLPAFHDVTLYLGLNCPIANYVTLPSTAVDFTTCANGNPTVRIPQLSPGTYYFPVRKVSGSSEGPYTLTISASACSGTPPANASCSGAIPLPVSSTCNPVSGTTAGATLTGTTSGGCAGGDPSDAVWYSFVATAPFHFVSLQPGPQFYGTIDVFTAPCGSGSLINCGYADGLGFPMDLPASGLTVGNTYYVRVYDNYSGTSATPEFGICVTGMAGDPCDAIAGTLTADLSIVCFENGSATLDATVNNDTVVPAGFTVLYLLSSAPGGVLRQSNTTPSFTVSTTGQYAIRTLVYDPNTFDPGTIVFGTTTADQLNGMFTQGGGSICAALAQPGAPITVQLCCDADAGTLTFDQSPVCLLNDTAVVSATPNGDIIVPPGFSVTYLLTESDSILIVQMDTVSSFVVTGPGVYTIHTLVYDSLTLDLDTIELGVTLGPDFDALLIQGGGVICAGLDREGAEVNVVDCSPANDDCANAIELPINAIGNCPDASVVGDNTYATRAEGDTLGCDETAVNVADVWYSFNSGDNTEVTIHLDQRDLENWGIAVSDSCGGTEFYCEATPTDTIVIQTALNTNYRIRVYTNTELGMGGEFGLCVSGAVPTFLCAGGTISSLGQGSIVCINSEADLIAFTNNSASVESYAYILTDANDTIIAVLDSSSLDFNELAMGIYHVWGVSYHGNLNAAADSLVTTITSDDGCAAFSSNFISISVDICSGVGTTANVNWVVFPNPTTGEFNVRYQGPDGQVNIDVVDMNGRLVLQERMNMTQGQTHLVNGTGKLLPGMYGVRLMGGTAVQTVRLTVR